MQGQHVAAESLLQRREAVKLIQHHVGGRVALQFDDDADAVAVALVLHMVQAFDLFLPHQFADATDQVFLVHLIGDLVDDDRVAVLTDLLHPRLGAHDDGSAPLVIRFARAGAAEDIGAGREIGRRDVLHQVGDLKVRVLDQRQRRIDHFAEVMRGNVRRHANGDAARAVDEDVRETRGQDGRFAVLAVIVVLKVDRVLLDILKKRRGGFVHADFGIAHGGGRIAVHRTKVALPIQQRQAHGEILRHADQRVIDRAVAMGVVFTHHVADRSGGFPIGFVVPVAGFVHRIKDAPVHRLQPVAHVRNRPADDDRHRIVEIAAPHLLLDRDGRAVICGAGRAAVFRAVLNVVVAQGFIPLGFVILLCDTLYCGARAGSS